MKKLVLVICLLFFLCGASAVSTDMKDSYVPKETVIVSFSEDVLNTIYKDQISLLKDGHIGVAFEYDIKKLGTKQYLWFNAPANSGNYTIKVKDIIAMVGGTPQILDYTKQFRVEGASADYSIKPGVVLATGDFEIIVNLYESASKSISVDFPYERQVTIVPGANSISFSSQGIVGTLSRKIIVGRYNVPIYLIGAASFCGDGLINGSEVCDGTNLNGKNCSSISSTFEGGNLKCASNCLSFVTSECTSPSSAVCDAEHKSLCTTAGTCLDAGGYWYNGTCNQDSESVCSTGHLELCLTNVSCINIGGYWYNSSCNLYEQNAVCDSQHLKLCKTHGTCLDAGGYWYNSSCNLGPELICGDGIINGSEVCDGTNLNGNNCSAQGFNSGNLSCSSGCLSFNVSSCFNVSADNAQHNFPPVFRFNTPFINSVILATEDAPAYTFRITNLGENSIDSLFLDYDRERFLIEPDEEIVLEPNESASFTLTLKRALRSNVRGVVLAYSGDVYEYLIFNLSVTSNEAETGTHYSGNSEVLLDCEEEGGVICGDDQECSTSPVQTRDGSCCLGLCTSSSGGSRSWIGYLIVGIAIIVLLIIYVKYRKTTPGSDPLGQRVSKIERKFP